MTKSYKHSGTLGDLLYSLALVRHFGPGEFYLHLDQINWIGQHYYGSPPAEYHRGRMNQKDFDFIERFMLAQPYITKFGIMTNDVAITHNLDRFRPLFVSHPADYVTTYCMAFGINDEALRTEIINGPWFSVARPRSIPGKPFVVNRTLRGFSPPGCNPQWRQWLDMGWDSKSVFVGFEEEHDAFQKLTGWKLDYYPVKDLLELAEVIAGCEFFMGNQSSALALAQGLRVPYAFETRRDLPMERNESLMPTHLNGSYF